MITKTKEYLVIERVDFIHPPARLQPTGHDSDTSLLIPDQKKPDLFDVGASKSESHTFKYK